MSFTLGKSTNALRKNLVPCKTSDSLTFHLHPGHNQGCSTSQASHPSQYQAGAWCPFLTQYAPYLSGSWCPTQTCIRALQTKL